MKLAELVPTWWPIAVALAAGIAGGSAGVATSQAQAAQTAQAVEEINEHGSRYVNTELGQVKVRLATIETKQAAQTEVLQDIKKQLDRIESQVD